MSLEFKSASELIEEYMNRLTYFGDLESRKMDLLNAEIIDEKCDLLKMDEYSFLLQREREFFICLFIGNEKKYKYIYDIDPQNQSLIDWIYHITEKIWVTADHIRSLIICWQFIERKDPDYTCKINRD